MVAAEGLDAHLLDYMYFQPQTNIQLLVFRTTWRMTIDTDYRALLMQMAEFI